MTFAEVERLNRRSTLAALGLALLLLSACSVSLIAPYDEPTDLMLTRLARDVDDHLSRANRLAFAEAGPVYARLLGDLSVIRLRASGLPRNDLTLVQLDAIRSSLVDLEDLHRAGPPSPMAAALARDALAGTIGAAIWAEMAKRRLR